LSVAPLKLAESRAASSAKYASGECRAYRIVIAGVPVSKDLLQAGQRQPRHDPVDRERVPEVVNPYIVQL
jgi:hypothetical protein